MAKNKIKLYTDSSTIRFYVGLGLKKAIKKKNLEVQLMSDDYINKNKFVEIFCPNKLYYKKTGSNFTLKSNYFGDADYQKIRHFMVVDETMFRVEVPHDKNDEVINSLGCFNDPIMG